MAQAGPLCPQGRKRYRDPAPMVCKKRTQDAECEDEQTRVFGFRTAYVFDVADTDGADLPQFATVSGDPQDYTERLKGFIANSGITVEYSDRIAPAKGLSQGGNIVLLPGMSAAETLSVLAHECAHELLHKGTRRAETTPKYERRKPKLWHLWSATRSDLKPAHRCQ